MKKEPLNKKTIYELLIQNNKVLDRYGVKTIGLFGSFAKGAATESSDIDFLVEFDLEKKTFKNFMDLAFYLEDLFGKKVDLVTPQGLSPYIGPHILNTVEYVPFRS